jgi:hypothetical protein
LAVAWEVQLEFGVTEVSNELLANLRDSLGEKSWDFFIFGSS